MQQLLLAVRATRRKRPKPRDKVFGLARSVALTRDQKACLALRLRELLRAKREKGKHYGRVSAKIYRIGMTLLYDFHNCLTGHCFPSQEKIAAKADCAVSTVARALAVLEEVGFLTWVNRLKRERERVDGLFGPLSALRDRVVRTSNVYIFKFFSSASDFQRGTTNQVQPRKTTAPTSATVRAPPQLAALKNPPPAAPPNPSNSLEQALARLGRAIGASKIV